MAKKTEKQKWHDKAWKVWSEYIRKRDPYCVTHLVMPEPKKIPSQQAGHFWHAVLDFDDENINGQCINCNHFNSGRLDYYQKYLRNKLGNKKFDALDIRHTRAIGGEGHDIEFYQSIIEKYDKKETTRKS